MSKSYRVYSDLRIGHGAAINIFNFFRKITGKGSKRVLALDGVTFQVRRGEVFGLLGPNGAGKTTLIKILSTLVLPDSGRAVVDGIDIVKRPRAAVKRLQTVLSESIGFDRRLTGRANLEFFAELYGIPKKEARERIDNLLKFTNMTESANVMFQRYSTGMMRKLLLCRALLTNASILLFDEPTASLDPLAASEFRKLIRHDLADRQKKTILLATHNLWEAEQICDRIALLKKGRIIAIGTPREIKDMVADKVNISMLVSNFAHERISEVTESLLKVKGISSVEVRDNFDDEGHVRINLEGNKNLNYNELFDKVSSFGLEINMLESMQPTLEEAFLKLNLEASR
ncbi:MAG: ABC transporter ATP-binding protein [Conexivisphaerales archaeon]